MILPDPGPDFFWRQSAYGPALVCRPVAAVAEHLFTTRPWPLGQRSGSDVDRDAAWAGVAEALNIAPGDLARAHQVHGAGVVPAHPRQAGARNLPSGDVIVARRALGCAIQTADCVPLLLADPHSGAVAAAHAGWRGLVQRVPDVAVAALVSSAGTHVGDLLAVIGPAIGPCCYEVGDDVRAAFGGGGFEGTDRDRWFSRQLGTTPRNPSLPHLPPVARSGRWYFDAGLATRDQLRMAGVRPERIYAAALCTASHAVFCSYHRDGTGAGRMAAAIRARDR